MTKVIKCPICKSKKVKPTTKGAVVDGALSDVGAVAESFVNDLIGHHTNTGGVVKSSLKSLIPKEFECTVCGCLFSVEFNMDQEVVSTKVIKYDDDKEDEDYGGSVIAKMLNITEERPKEIEKVVPVKVRHKAPKRNFKKVYTIKDYLKRRKKDYSNAPTHDQMMMYVGAGVYWDDGAAGDNQRTYTLPDGGTYHTGLWVMKKEYISGFSEGKAQKKEEIYYYESGFHEGRPSADEIYKYFFLPAAGFYDDGCLKCTGFSGDYWSKDCGLTFDFAGVEVLDERGSDLLMIVE